MPQIQYLVNTQDSTKLYSWQTNSFEDLRASIIREFPALGEYFAISYFDEEGDSIKVTSEPEFEEALNYAKQSECFLPIIIVEEEAPVPEEAPVAPEEPESPAFNAQDLFSRLCEFPSADNESVASNPIFRKKLSKPHKISSPCFLLS